MHGRGRWNRLLDMQEMGAFLARHASHEPSWADFGFLSHLPNEFAGRR